ncbi:MAG: hypothetical protein U5L00_06215 [Desulfovermiculus sp.]|nr:hypothetical protein [Desulfovermiculus sp.]
MNRVKWPRFIPGSERRAQAEKRLEALRTQGVTIQPERVTGRDMARTVWGRGWCGHVQSLPKVGKHLPRGQIYARNGSIKHLDILPGQVKALVMGTEVYEVVVRVLPVSGSVWQEAKDLCIGRIDSVQDIYKGNLPDMIMSKLLDSQRGIFPGPKEFSLCCECSERIPVCKHVAAVLYGIGSRLDQKPELLFRWRGVHARDLVSSWTKDLRERFAEKKNILNFEQAKDIFDIEWDDQADIPEIQGMPPDRHEK